MISKFIVIALYMTAKLPNLINYSDSFCHIFLFY